MPPMNCANALCEGAAEPGVAAPLSPALALLCACVRGDPPERLGGLLAGVQEVGESVHGAAQQHGLAPLAYLELREAGLVSSLPPEERGGLAKAHELIASQQTLLYATGHELVGMLKTAGLRWALPVKGLALAALLWPEYLPRAMDDLDLLVPQDGLAEAERALCEAGFVHADVPPAAWVPHHHARTLRRGIAFAELHWAMWTPDALPLPHPDPESIARRAIRGTLNDQPVEVPHPADAFILTAGALARDGFAVPLRAWADLYWLLAHPQVGLVVGALLDLAYHLGLGGFIGLMVRLVEWLFGDRRSGAAGSTREVAEAAARLQPIVARRLSEGTHRSDRHAMLLQLLGRTRHDRTERGGRTMAASPAPSRRWPREALAKAAGYAARLTLSRRQRRELREELAINRSLEAVARANLERR